MNLNTLQEMAEKPDQEDTCRALSLVTVQPSRTREELDAQWIHMEEMTRTRPQVEAGAEAPGYDETHFGIDLLNETDEA